MKMTKPMCISKQIYSQIVSLCFLQLFFVCRGQADQVSVVPLTCQGCSALLSFPASYGQKVIHNITWSKVSNGVTVATASNNARNDNSQLTFTAGLGYASKVTWAGTANLTYISLLDVAPLDAGNYSCILQFTDGTRLTSLALINPPLPTWKCRTQSSSVHKTANSTHYVLTTNPPTYTAGCSATLTWTDSGLNKVYMRQQSAVSVCDGSRGTCQLSVAIYSSSSPIQTTMTYCAAWYIGSSLDYVPQCFSVPQLPNRFGLKQFACVNQTMLLQCPGNLRVSVIRAMFGDMQRACASNYSAVCSGDGEEELLVPGTIKTCTTAAPSSQTYCRSTLPFPGVVAACTSHPACGIKVFPSMTAYCPSAPLTGSFMLMVEYNCVPGPLTFTDVPSQQSQCQHCQQLLPFRYDYPDEVVNSILWTRVDDQAVLGLVTVMDDRLLYSGNVNIQPLWISSDPASLTLINLSPSDTGTYRCELRFVSGNYITGQTYLNATLPLKSCRKSLDTISQTETDVEVTISVTQRQFTDGCPAQLHWMNCNTSKPVDLSLQGADEYSPTDRDDNSSYELVVPKFGVDRTVVCYCTSWWLTSYLDNSTAPFGLCVTQVPQPPTVTVTEHPVWNATTSKIMVTHPGDTSSAAASFQRVLWWTKTAFCILLLYCFFSISY